MGHAQNHLIFLKEVPHCIPTVGPRKEFKEGGMTTIPVTTKSKSKDSLPSNMQPIYNPVITKKVKDVTEILATTEMATTVPVPAQKDGLLLRIVRRMVAFYDCLDGPPKTERERTRRAISESERWGKYEQCRYL